MNNKVIFFGALGGRVGGGESGNKRTLFFFNKIGLEVIVVSKPYPVKSKIKYISYPINLVLSLIKFSINCHNAKYSHISAFYGNLVYFELFMVLISKLFNNIVVYEIRGGGMDYFYAKKSPFYRFCFRSVIRLSDFILSQGKENFKTLNIILSDLKKTYYYPNVLSDEKSPNKIINRNYNGEINLIYFGRFSRDKNINIIILAVKQLLQKTNIDFKLKLIGNFDNFNYEKEIRNEVVGFEDHITILPPCDFSALRLHLTNSHFFIFPTSNFREGQSNSLTEAMMFGIIPIASKQGFNESTIDNNLLMLEDINCEVIVEKILNILSLGQDELSSLSFDLQVKCRQKFNQKFATNVLREVYER